MSAVKRDYYIIIKKDKEIEKKIYTEISYKRIKKLAEWFFANEKCRSVEIQDIHSVPIITFSVENYEGEEHA